MEGVQTAYRATQLRKRAPPWLEPIAAHGLVKFHLERREFRVQRIDDSGVLGKLARERVDGGFDRCFWCLERVDIAHRTFDIPLVRVRIIVVLRDLLPPLKVDGLLASLRRAYRGRSYCLSTSVYRLRVPHGDGRNGEDVPDLVLARKSAARLLP